MAVGDVTVNADFLTKSYPCVSFDGVDDNIIITKDTHNNIISGVITTFSISMFAKFTSTSSYGFIFSFSNQGQGGTEIFRNTGAGTIRFEVADAGGAIAAPYFTLSGSTNCADGLWHHIVAVKDTTQATLYVDGVLQQQVTNTNMTVPITSASNIVLGARGSGGVQFPYAGLLRDLRIYRKALSTAEISTLATGASIEPSKLVLSLKFNGNSNDDLGLAFPVDTGVRFITDEELVKTSLKNDRVNLSGAYYMVATGKNSNQIISAHIEGHDANRTTSS